VRGASADGAAPGTQVVEVDARDTESVAEAAHGMDVILHALNPPYTDWATQMPVLAEAAIAATRASNATLLLPGNLYNYGAAMPEVLDERTPMRPTSHKGVLRVALETQLREAGIRAIVLRAGDFFGGGSSGSWFDRVITRYVEHGRLTYPGPLDVVHGPTCRISLPRWCRSSKRGRNSTNSRHSVSPATPSPGQSSHVQSCGPCGAI
jgi:nucleoside-diphosphate-sugar epimerase